MMMSRLSRTSTQVPGSLSRPILEHLVEGTPESDALIAHAFSCLSATKKIRKALKNKIWLVKDRDSVLARMAAGELDCVLNNLYTRGGDDKAVVLPAHERTQGSHVAATEYAEYFKEKGYSMAGSELSARNSLRLLGLLQLDADDHFIDLGSANGRFTLAAALSTSVAVASGVELSPSRTECARQARGRIESACSSHSAAIQTVVTADGEEPALKKRATLIVGSQAGSVGGGEMGHSAALEPGVSSSSSDGASFFGLACGQRVILRQGDVLTAFESLEEEEENGGGAPVASHGKNGEGKEHELASSSSSRLVPFPTVVWLAVRPRFSDQLVSALLQRMREAVVNEAAARDDRGADGAGGSGGANKAEVVATPLEEDTNRGSLSSDERRHNQPPSSPPSSIRLFTASIALDIDALPEVTLERAYLFQDSDTPRPEGAVPGSSPPVQVAQLYGGHTELGVKNNGGPRIVLEYSMRPRA
jgi:hypothetical protein